MEVQHLLTNSRVNITAEEKRYLGAVIGSTEYRDEYVKDLVKDWDNQFTILSTIAETQPQAAYGGWHICSVKERVLISLHSRYGGLTISIFHETAEIEFMICSKTKSELTALIRKVYSTI